MEFQNCFSTQDIDYDLVRNWFRLLSLFNGISNELLFAMTKRKKKASVVSSADRTMVPALVVIKIILFPLRLLICQQQRRWIPPKTQRENGLSNLRNLSLKMFPSRHLQYISSTNIYDKNNYKKHMRQSSEGEVREAPGIKKNGWTR